MDFLINAIEADRPTVNGRTYSRKAIEAAVVQVKERIANGTCFVTYGNQGAEIDLSKIAGIVNDINIEDNKMKISFESIDRMPFGAILKNIELPNTEIFPVFIGSVDSNGKVSEDDLKLISFNFQFKK